MARTIHTPGEVIEDRAVDVASPPRTAAELEVLLAASEAALAAAKAAGSSKMPTTIYEPVTPHGAIARADSAVAHLTVAQVMAEIDAGRLREPVTGMLCADGYYCRRT
jgi:hypothetical protein